MYRTLKTNAALSACCGLLLLWISLLGATPAVKNTDPARGLEGEGQVELLHHDITIQLIPDQHLLKSRDSLTLAVISPHLKEVSLYLNKNLTVRSVRLKNALIRKVVVKEAVLPQDENKRRLYQDYQDTRIIKIALPKKVKKGQQLQLEISYQGEIFETPKDPSGPPITADETTGLISEDGIFLSGENHWYPDLPNSLFTSNLSVEIPNKWEAITQGILMARSILSQGTMTAWHSTVPADSLTIIAAKYVVRTKKVNGVEISTYFYPEESSLSQEYQDAAANYLQTFSELLGPYPFSKFVIVEGFFPAGLGFPSFTFLGQQVIKRHYTQPYALGHELVHCWLGNYVFNDLKSGNWTEGLTTYLANYYYDEQTQGREAAKALRQRMILEYSTYKGEGQDYPLDQFINKESPLDDAVGYQKTAMVFHMLRNQIGDEAFFKALAALVEQFGAKRAGWQDLKKLFEETSKQDLTWFFQQWVYDKGAPILAVKGISKKILEKGYEVTVDLAQLTKPFRLTVPVRIDTADRAEFKTVQLTAPLASFSFKTSSEPKSLMVDPDYQILRQLIPSEMPPNLNRYLQDPVKLVVYPTQGNESENKLYKDLAERIEEKSKAGLSQPDRQAGGGQVRLVPDVGLKEEDLKDQSVLFLGGEGVNAAIEKLKDRLSRGVEIDRQGFQIKNDRYRSSDNALLVSLVSPFNPSRIITVFLGLSESAASKVAPRLFYYGWDSYLVFDGGKAIAKGDFPPQAEPMMVRIE
jgi:aminopeptidase N